MTTRKTNQGTIDINALQQDAHNFNKGTDEGRRLMDKSFQELGAGRSILLDKDNNIIAGNKSQEAAIRAGIKRVRVIETDGCKVFGTFVCGGGSSMGYKLAGFTHLGGVEIVPSVAAVYRFNHHPKYLYVEDLRQFNQRQDLPAELYQLDILDGSPPCSTFSISGDREKAWGKKKRFAEGQEMQTLDDLVFVHCDTIAKLMPKVCWLENVPGLVKGNAKVYANKIVQRLKSVGYRVQVFLLNAMGVPQRRERVFFIGLRDDFDLPKLVLDFDERPITFGEVWDKDGTHPGLDTEYQKEVWENKKRGDRNYGDVNERLKGKASNFNCLFLYDNEVAPTLTSLISRWVTHFSRPCKVNPSEIKRMSTFPQDYNSPTKDIGWLCGMSVPPVMVAQLSYQIWLQWLRRIKAAEVATDR